MTSQPAAPAVIIGPLSALAHLSFECPCDIPTAASICRLSALPARPLSFRRCLSKPNPLPVPHRWWFMFFNQASLPASHLPFRPHLRSRISCPHRSCSVQPGLTSCQPPTFQALPAAGPASRAAPGSPP